MSQEWEQLEQRRLALLVRSELQRSMLRLECVRLRPYLGYIETGRQVLRTARPFWTIAAPALGLLMATRWRKTIARISSGMFVWKSVRKIWSAWTGAEDHHDESRPE